MYVSMCTPKFTVEKKKYYVHIKLGFNYSIASSKKFIEFENGKQMY